MASHEESLSSSVASVPADTGTYARAGSGTAAVILMPLLVLVVLVLALVMLPVLQELQPADLLAAAAVMTSEVHPQLLSWPPSCVCSNILIRDSVRIAGIDDKNIFSTS